MITRHLLGQAGFKPDEADSGAVTLIQRAAWTCRVAFGPRAGQKVLTVQGALPRQTDFKQTLCADIDGFSLHAAVRCGADDRQALEQPCRHITRPALANEHVQTNAAAKRQGATRVDGTREDAFRLGCQRPTDPRLHPKTDSRASGAVYCRVQGAMGTERERLKILPSNSSPCSDSTDMGLSGETPYADAVRCQTRPTLQILTSKDTRPIRRRVIAD